MSKAIVYPAHGWLPPNAHVMWERTDQGKDFVTDWDGVIQAPGAGVCVRVGSDRPFPSGFGPQYPVVAIRSGPFAGHEFYIGHCSSSVSVGEHFGFGHPLARANQGHPEAIGIHPWFRGGWVELGEAFGGSPGPMSSWHWFDAMLQRPLVVQVADPALRLGARGLRVLGMTSQLRNCGWLGRPYFHFNRIVHSAVIAFQRHHHLPVDGVVGPRTANVLNLASKWCRKHKKEV